MPMELRWTIHSEAAGYAVFVDRVPVAPGAPVTASGDVVLTGTATSVQLTRLARTFQSTHQAVLTVVPLDATGHRLGEDWAGTMVAVSPLGGDT